MDPHVFAFTRSGILLGADDAPRAPRRSDLERAGISFGAARPMGGEHAFVWLGDAEVTGLRTVGLRSLFGAWDQPELERAFLASQLAHFDAMSRFCGQCGEPTIWKAGDAHVKSCARCEREIYPQISPCAIVRVSDGDRILLARKAMFPGGFYGLVAGFLEPAETLEECAAREVMEETGVRVRDVQYFGSQPWPFPSQLMVGFTATFDGGEIVVDTSELEDARWFRRGELPRLPPSLSIARRMIDAWALG